MTSMVTTDLSAVEGEFARKCQNFKQCKNDAAWMGWSSHGASMCPASCYVCDKCKSHAEDLWARHLRIGHRCDRCRVRVTGQVSDHLRFIKL